MSVIVSMLGGSGSRQLVSNLLHLGESVHVRPELAWIPARFGRPQYEMLNYWRQELDDDCCELLDGKTNLDRKAQGWLTFRSRTQWMYEPDCKSTLMNAMYDYCAWCRQEQISLVSERLAELSVFSRHSIPDVVFVFRHPLRSYLAFCENRLDYCQRLGGIEGARSIAFWADAWARQAAEYLALKRAQLNPVKVLYESVQSTCPRRLLPLFDGWHRGNRRRSHKLPDGAIELMRLHVDDYMQPIYGSRDYGWRRQR